MTPSDVKRKFIITVPERSTYFNAYARILERAGLLRLYILGTRRGIPEVPGERTRLNPAIGLIGYIGSRMLPPFRAESFRYKLLPWFDRWAKKKLLPGDYVISSYGFVNEGFKWVRSHGGKTIWVAGNSHPENFWTILSEEARRWQSPYPPIWERHYRRSLAMLEHVDYVLSPSSFVSRSFIERGFSPDQILYNPYPTELSFFQPRAGRRPKDRPLTIINTGALSLRKGTPYLLESFRILMREHPSVRFLLTRNIRDEIQPILSRYSDLPIEWSPNLPHSLLAERLRSADIFVLPSLEDGWALAVSEAMACGLPVIVTPSTGASDLVQPGVSGEIVPIRDPRAIADAVLKWAEVVLRPDYEPTAKIDRELLSFEYFEKTFIGYLKDLGFAVNGKA